MKKVMKRFAAFLAALALAAGGLLWVRQEDRGDPWDGVLPAYAGEPWVVLGDGRPNFGDGEGLPEAGEAVYSPLDPLGRCGPAVACLGPETMPEEPRGEIGMVKPSGWHTVKYDCVDGRYLYNRCHLIAYQLAGENDNEQNLITGTRYLNIQGMLPFENQVADYIRATGNHVLYRVTPVFSGDDLVAGGVRMEARSVEDGGEGLSFHIYAYNVQPGVTIDYATGESRLAEETEPAAQETEKEPSQAESPPPAEAEKEPPAEQEMTAEDTEDVTYILNTRSRRFHLPECPGAADIAAHNRQTTAESREELLAQGYQPCGWCKP